MRLVCALLVNCIAAVNASACAVCFGDPADFQTRGMNWAIFTLMVITAGVLASVISFAVLVRRRTAALNATETAEWAGETDV